MSDTGEFLLEVRNITKEFGALRANDNISLSLKPGEIHALLGENGAGKSTLARILGTLWAPSRGKGKILGQELGKGNREIRRRSSMVSDQSFLRSELSLEENLIFYGTLYGVRDNRRAAALIEQFGLYKRRKDQVSTFSQGMVKRANLARSLLHDPDLWILDEPFGALDALNRTQLHEWMMNLLEAYREKSDVKVTHDVEEALYLSDR